MRTQKQIAASRENGSKSHGAASPVSPATQTPKTQLQIRGSLRKNDSGDPAAGESPPTPVLEHKSFSESVFGIGGSSTSVRGTQGVK